MSITLAAAVVIGAHIGSYHAPDNGRVNNNNPGLYLRADSGLTGGFYRNSHRRMSVYAGYAHEWGPVGFVVGGITGYDKEHGGHSSSPVSLLVAASIKGPTVFGVTPRLAYIPGRLVKAADVWHAMVEVRF